jgi:hypothetical protein
MALPLAAMAFACTGSDGQNGVSAVVATAAEPPGQNCPTGGVAVSFGQDSNANGALDDSEVSGTTYVCNGTEGATGADGTPGTSGGDGADGVDGLTSLITVTPEGVGDNCSGGGHRVEVGIDDDRDGILDVDEIDQTSYVCDGSDGADGADGLQTLVAVTHVAAGPGCIGGAQRIDWGVDDSGNGVLEAEEVDGSEYVCDPYREAYYGWPEELAGSSGHSPDYLLGVPLTVESGLLRALAVIGKEAGPSFKLALYTDSAGAPGALVASTAARALEVGRNEVPVDPVVLSAGTYWIMGIYQSLAHIGYAGSGSEPVKYVSLPFGDALPSTFPSIHNTSSGSTYNYYVVMHHSY